MKSYLASLIVFFLLVGVSCEQETDIEKEKAAIMAVIEEETTAFCADDTSRWASTYVQDSTTINFFIWKNGYTMTTGWDKHFARVLSFFSGKKLENNEIKTPILIKVYDESAWVVFKNKTPDNEALVTCFLQKSGDIWKIEYRGVLWTATYYDVDYFLINSINHAKSMGQSVEQFADFTGNQFKTAWNQKMELNGIVNGIKNNWGSIVKSENMKVLEQDENHVVLLFTDFLVNLKDNGPFFNVSYDDYIIFYKVTFEVIADHLGFIYTQETVPNGVKVTVAKK